MKTTKLPVPQEVTALCDTLRGAGFQAYLVGGCVRDLLIGREPKDWDITTDTTPETIQSLFEETFYENKFGTVGVITQSQAPRLHDKRHRIRPGDRRTYRRARGSRRSRRKAREDGWRPA